MAVAPSPFDFSLRQTKMQITMRGVEGRGWKSKSNQQNKNRLDDDNTFG
jgi:hypothetical protein